MTRSLKAAILNAHILLFCLVSAQLSMAAQAPSLSPKDLARRAVANETAPDANKFMFRSRKQSPHSSQTHLYVQAQEATAGMLIAINDQALNAQQLRSEEDRLDYLVRNPSELKRKRKQEKEDSDRVSRIVAAMPEAFTYEYAGEEAGLAEVGGKNHRLVRLKFRANAKYTPPSRVEQVLTGMQGYMLIDARQFRIAKIDGTLYKDVGFGWGILGHLDKGGKFIVSQAEIAAGSWATTSMTLNFTGKILLFRNLVIDSKEDFSDFKQVPSTLTFADAVALLKKREAEANDRKPQNRP